MRNAAPQLTMNENFSGFIFNTPRGQRLGVAQTAHTNSTNTNTPGGDDKGCDQAACFVAGTRVRTPQGSKPIENFKGGELVLSRHEHTQEFGYHPVARIKVTHGQALYKVVIADALGRGETLRTTGEHPFWVQGAGWTKAADLAVGMALVDHNGQPLEVMSQTALDETETVYNILVQEHRTFHVGELGVWVHNAHCCDTTAGGCPTNQRTHA